MLSPTRDDMKTFAYGGPEEIRSASQKAMHIWVGATSPLWAPFWVASSLGVGVWTAAQAFKRAQEASRIAPERLADLMLTPAATDVAGTVQDMVREGLIAPMQTAASAVEQVVSVIAGQTPSPEAIADQMKAAGDQISDAAVETVDAATDSAEDTTIATEAVAETVAGAGQSAADTAAEVTKTVAENAAEVSEDAVTVAKAATAAASDTAISAADAPKAVTPRKPRKS